MIMAAIIIKYKSINKNTRNSCKLRWLWSTYFCWECIFIFTVFRADQNHFILATHFIYPLWWWIQMS